MKRVLLACALVVPLAHEAFGWGNVGHQAVGAAAQTGLTAKAHEGLAKLFGHGATLAPGTLAKVATWPDDVRNRMVHGTVAEGWDPTDVKEADKFNKDHKANALWHFVNLPLGAKGYPTATTSADDPVREFTRPDDIVQMIGRCIEILESENSPTNFTKIQAVRWRVHLVGDIHQPYMSPPGTTLRLRQAP